MSDLGSWILVFWISVVAGIVGSLAMLEITHQRRHPDQHPRRPDDGNRRRHVVPRPRRRSTR